MENKQIFKSPTTSTTVSHSQTITSQIDIDLVSNEQIFNIKVHDIKINSSQTFNCLVESAKVSNNQVFGTCIVKQTPVKSSMHNEVYVIPTTSTYTQCSTAEFGNEF